MDEGLKLEGLMMVLVGEVVMNVKLVMEMAWMMRLTIEEIVFDKRSLSLSLYFRVGFTYSEKVYWAQTFLTQSSAGLWHRSKTLQPIAGGLERRKKIRTTHPFLDLILSPVEACLITTHKTHTTIISSIIITIARVPL